MSTRTQPNQRAYGVRECVRLIVVGNHARDRFFAAISELLGNWHVFRCRVGAVLDLQDCLSVVEKTGTSEALGLAVSLVCVFVFLKA